MELLTVLCFQAGLNFRMFVRRITVQNQVKRQGERGLPVELLQKAQPLLVPVTRGHLAKDFAIQIRQRRKQGDRAVAVVVEGLSSDVPIASGKAGEVRSSA
jgi:hypothetical protein